MSELKSNRFTKYFPLLLDALRSTDPTPMRPAEARAWIRDRIDVAAEDLTRLIKAKSKQTIFENDVHWARFYLAKAGLIASPKRGFRGLTPVGRSTHLTREETWNFTSESAMQTALVRRRTRKIFGDIPREVGLRRGKGAVEIGDGLALAVDASGFHLVDQHVAAPTVPEGRFGVPDAVRG